jgi:cytochrome P450
MVAVSAGPVYDPSSWAVQDDPFPIYAQLQEQTPIYHNPELGFWALSRFDDVLAGLNEQAALSSARGTLVEQIQLGEPPPEMMIFTDPPRHDVLRKLVNRAFTPRRITALEPEIRNLCRGWLDPFVEAGGGDIVAALAARLPMTVISRLLGAPASDDELLKELSDRLLRRDEGSLAKPEDAGAAGAELFAYFSDLVAHRRVHPADDLISALIAAEIDGTDGGTRRLNDDELVLFCLLLGVAGNETTSKLIATGVVTLAAFPDERRRLVDDRGLWHSAIEELLRFDPPSHYQGRVTTRDLTWYGQRVPQGAIVLLVNGAANRDPREFERPEHYVCDRRIERHLAFGHGIHFCLGAALARLETRVALQELLARVPRYAVDDERVERFHSSNVRGLSKVPISATDD